MEPVLYPFNGRVNDIRGKLRYTIDQLLTYFKTKKSIKVTNLKEQTIYTFEGLYSYSFITLNDVLNKYNVSDIQRKNIENQINTFHQEGKVTKFLALSNAEILENKLDSLDEYYRNFGILLLTSSGYPSNTVVNLYAFFLRLANIFDYTSVGNFAFSKSVFVRDSGDDDEVGQIFPILTLPSANMEKTLNGWTCYIQTSKPREIVLSSGLKVSDIIGTGLSYNIYWLSTNVSNQDVFNYILENDTQYLACHLTFTFNRPHIHGFTNYESMEAYYFYCVYRTFVAQIKFQSCDGLITEDRRGCHVPICSKLFIDEFIIKRGYSPQHLPCVPSPYTDVNEIPMSLSVFVNDLSLVLARYSCVLNAYSPYVFLLYHQMFEMMRFLIMCIDIINVVNVVEVSLNNKVDGDKHVDTPVRYIEFPSDFNLDYHRTSSHYKVFGFQPRFSGGIPSEFIIPKHIELPTSTIEREYIPYHDDLVFENYRRAKAITGPLSGSFIESVNPLNVHKLIYEQKFLQTLTKVEQLMMSAYIFDEPVNFRFDVEGPNVPIYDDDHLVVIPTESISSCDVINKINGSTLKIVGLIFEYIIKPSLSVIIMKKNVLFLGAIDEPAKNILSHIVLTNWNMKGIGWFARKPNLRASLENLAVNGTYDYVISDIDMSVINSVGEGILLIKSIVTKILNITVHIGIVKIEYGLANILDAAQSVIPCWNRIVKSSVSRSGSIEYFIIFDKFKEREEIYNLNILYSCTYSDGYSDERAQIQIYNYQELQRMAVSNKLFIPGVITIDTDIDRFYGDLSYIMTFSSEAISGFDSKEVSSTTSGSIFGFLSYERFLLYRRDANVKMLRVGLNNHYQLNGFITSNDAVYRSKHHVAAFTQSQRSLLAKIWNSQFHNYINFLPSKVIYDIGCRAYHGIIFCLKNIFNYQYIGYDDDITIPNIGRRMALIRETVDINKILQLIAAGGLIVAYNSLFMSYKTSNELYTDITRAITAINSLNAVLIISFYVIDERNRVQCQNNGIRFILDPNTHNFLVGMGNYEPVAALTIEQYNTLLDESTFPGVKIIQPNLTHDRLFLSQLEYGNGPSLISHYFLPLLSSLQRAIIVEFKPLT